MSLKCFVVGNLCDQLNRHGFNLTWEALSALRSWSRLWRHEWITVAVQVPEVALSGVFAGWLVAKLHHRNQKVALAEIASRCTEVESGAHNVDNILTHTLLPQLSVLMLGRIAEGQELEAIHVGVGEDGRFVYS